MVGPTDCAIAVTYKCDSRCTMCNIWKKPPMKEAPPEVLLSLPRSLKYVNITGGEPLLRKDLEKVISIVASTCPKATIEMTSNGLEPALVRQRAPKLLKEGGGRFRVGISVDGIGETHDKIRGVPRAFDKAVQSAQEWQQAGCEQIGLNFTIGDLNAEEIVKVYELSKMLGASFGATIVHASEHYFDTPHDKIERHKWIVEALNDLVCIKLRSASPKKWAKSFYYKGLAEFAQGKKRALGCDAATGSFFIAPDGTLYPCNVRNNPMGNLGERDFNEIWRSEAAEITRRLVAACTKNCWMACNAVSAIKRHIVRVGVWALIGKMKAHLGMRVIN